MYLGADWVTDRDALVGMNEDHWCVRPRALFILILFDEGFPCRNKPSGCTRCSQTVWLKYHHTNRIRVKQAVRTVEGVQT